MKSGYWIAIGAMLIPSAMIWILETPDDWNIWLKWVPAFILTFFGIKYLRNGWVDIEKESKRIKNEEIKSQKRERRRIRESRLQLIVLSHISQKDPISMRKVDRILKRWIEEYEEKERELTEEDDWSKEDYEL